MSPRRIDLKGKKFGKLTVIATAENLRGKTAWLCKCDCGKMVNVQTRLLRSGKVRDCGCQPRVAGIEKLNYVEGTCIEMIENRKLRSNNTSGCTGVSRVKKTGHWRAEITCGGHKMNLGTYRKIEDAIEARREAEVKYFDRIIEKYRQNKH